jgi:hypothetical protein
MRSGCPRAFLSATRCRRFAAAPFSDHTNAPWCSTIGGVFVRVDHGGVGCPRARFLRR